MSESERAIELSLEHPGKLIRRLREEQGLTRRALAAKAGYHWRTVEEIERAKCNPGWRKVLDLLNVLGCQLHLTLPKLHALDVPDDWYVAAQQGKRSYV